MQLRAWQVTVLYKFVDVTALDGGCSFIVDIEAAHCTLGIPRDRQTEFFDLV